MAAPEPEQAVTYEWAQVEPVELDQDLFYVDYLSQSILEEQVRQCVSVESPVHEARVIRHVADCWGFGRAGHVVQERVSNAIAHTVESGSVAQRGSFLWRIDMDFDSVPVRVPRNGEPLRPIELVSLEELAQAALVVLQANLSLPLEDAVAATARVLQYSRAKARIRPRVAKAIDLLTEKGRAKVANRMVTLVPRDGSER